MKLYGKFTHTTALLLGVLLIMLLYAGAEYRKQDQKNNLLVPTHIQKVYDDIVKASNETDIPKLVILEDFTINAMTDGKTVYVFTGLLEYIDNDDELALVLGHELAHALNHDIMHRDLDSRIVEQHADQMGAYFSLKAGYDPCKGRMFFDKMRRDFPDSAIGDHPSDAFRYANLQFPNCR